MNLVDGKDYIIDAKELGNFSRFMNHSCEPNCQAEKSEDTHHSEENLRPVVIITAKKEEH